MISVVGTTMVGEPADCACVHACECLRAKEAIAAAAAAAEKQEAFVYDAIVRGRTHAHVQLCTIEFGPGPPYAKHLEEHLLAQHCVLQYQHLISSLSPLQTCFRCGTRLWPG